MRKFFRISEVFSRLSGNRADSFAERIRGRKNGRNRFEERKLHLETLEERQLLAVTAAEYEAIRQAFDFGLAEDQAATDVIEVTDLSADALQKAVFQAGQSSQNDLIVIRTGALDTTLDLGGESILACGNASACGTLSIVAWNEGTDSGNLNLTVSAGTEAFDVALGTELHVGNITVNGAAVSTSAKSVSVKAGATAEVNYLVIFSGGETPEGNTSVFYDEVVRLYDIARQQYSVKAENIYILYADGTDPADDQNIAAGEGATPILINSDMSFATRSGAHVLSASYDHFLSVMGQVGGKMDGNDHLLLFTADHGSGVEGEPEVDASAIVGWNSESISGERFAQAVFSVTAGYVTLVETQCFSGGILDNVIDPATGKSRNPNISETDAAAKWYGMAAANYYETSWYDYTTTYDAQYDADVIVRDSEVSFATTFLDAFEQGGDYVLGASAFDYAKANDPFTADEKYKNNAGTYAEGTEHPWGAGATFRIFTDWEPEQLAAPEIELIPAGASTVELTVMPVENASGYTVEWSVDSTFSDYQSRYYNVAGTYEIANLKDNTEYYFRVRAEGSELYVDSNWTIEAQITDTYTLPSIENAHFVVTDGNDETNQLYGVGVEIAWKCGEFGTIGDSFTVLTDKTADGTETVTLTLEGKKTWAGNFNFLIDGENNGAYWDVSEDKTTAKWSNKDNIESPKREFTFVVWNDENGNDAIDSGEEYNSFTVSVQWANISICVDQPFPGSDEVYYFEKDAQGNITEYSAGHGFWDNRTTDALLNSAIIGNYLNKFANTSEGYGSTLWGTEAIEQLINTGNFICPGRTHLSPNGDKSLARWSNVDAYKTFTIASLSDYLNLLQYNKEIYENPPEYVQVQTDTQNEMQCMVAALGALKAAGFTVESYPQGETPTGLYDFEYEWTDIDVDVPKIPGLSGTPTTFNYVGTSPAHVGQDLVRDGGQYTFGQDENGKENTLFNGRDLNDQQFPQPKENGSYSVSDMRAFLASLKTRNQSSVTEAERAKLQNYLLTLSSYTVDETDYFEPQNVLYLDFGQFEATGNGGNLQGWTGYTLDYDETRVDENGFYAFTFDELVAMYEAWVTTSEDFAPFNINVTLDIRKYIHKFENAEGKVKLHALVGGLEADWRGIDDNERPITVFGDNMFYVFASGFGDGAQIGNLISHEAGLSLGLKHWSQPRVELYPGNDEWGPIMGETESGKLTQWSRGEYPDAINGADGKAATDQDDIAFLTDKLGLRPDENNVSIYTATSLDLSKVTSATVEIALAEGIIGGYWNGNPSQSNVEAGEDATNKVTTVFGAENDDADYYMFELTDDSQAYHFNIGGILADGITNLDVRVNVYNAAGELLQTYDNVDSLNIGFTFGGQTGIYYLSVMGTGKKTEIDGIYSDYASLGMYDIRVKKGTVLRVNTTSDIVNANDNYLSLREAITAANALADDETAFIYFENEGNYTLNGQELALRHSVNLFAEGKDVTINGAGLSRVMSIGSSTGKEINVKIDGINITGGLVSNQEGGAGVYIYANANVEMTDVSVYANQSLKTEEVIDEETGEPVIDEETGEPVTVTTPDGFGGGIWSFGNLTMTDSRVSNNTSLYGGGIANYGTFTADNVTIQNNTGHGVYSARGTVVMDRSTLENNAAADSGGGININNGTAALTETVIRGNRSVTCGGGAFVSENGTLLLDHVTVSDNSSTGHGGGIDVNGGTLHVVDTTVTNNSAFDYGGGISAHTGGNANRTANVTIVDSTISNNSVNGTRTYNEEGAVTGIGEAVGGGLSARGSAVFSVTGTLIAENRVDNRGTVLGEISPSTAVGGGVYASGAGVVMTFFESEIMSNEATGLLASGGGFYIAGGADVTLSNTTVRKHQTTGYGAGIYVIYNEGSDSRQTTLTVNQTSYIEHNEIYTTNTDAAGAGIYASVAKVTIDKSYIQNNAINISEGSVGSTAYAYGAGLALVNNASAVYHSDTLLVTDPSALITDSEFYMNSIFFATGSGNSVANAYGRGAAIYSFAIDGLEMYNTRVMCNILDVYGYITADGRGGGVYSRGGRINGCYIVQNELSVEADSTLSYTAGSRVVAYGGGVYADGEVISTVIAENYLFSRVDVLSDNDAGGAGITNVGRETSSRSDHLGVLSNAERNHLEILNCTITDNMGFRFRTGYYQYYEYVAGVSSINNGNFVSVNGIGYRSDPESYNSIIIRNTQTDHYTQEYLRSNLFNYLQVSEVDQSLAVWNLIFESDADYAGWHNRWLNSSVPRFLDVYTNVWDQELGIYREGYDVYNGITEMQNGLWCGLQYWESYLYSYWGVSDYKREFDYLYMYSSEAWSYLLRDMQADLDEITRTLEAIREYQSGLDDDDPDKMTDEQLDALEVGFAGNFHDKWWGQPIRGSWCYRANSIFELTSTNELTPTIWRNVYTDTGSGNYDVSWEHQPSVQNYGNNGSYIHLSGSNNIVGTYQFKKTYFGYVPEPEPYAFNYTDTIYNGSNNIDYVEQNLNNGDVSQSFFLHYGTVGGSPSGGTQSNWILGDYHINPLCEYAIESALDNGQYIEITSHGTDLKDAGGAARLYKWYEEGESDPQLRDTLDRGAYEMKPDTEIYGYDDYAVIDFNRDAIVVTTLWDYVNPYDGVISLREALGYFDAFGEWINGYANDDSKITFADYLMGGAIYYTPLSVFTPYQAETATYTIDRAIIIDARNKKENDEIGIYIDAFGRIELDKPVAEKIGLDDSRFDEYGNLGPYQVNHDYCLPTKTSTDSEVFELIDNRDVADYDENIAIYGVDMQWAYKIIPFIRPYYYSSNTSILHTDYDPYDYYYNYHYDYDTNYTSKIYSTNLRGINSRINGGSILIDGCKIHDFYKNGLQFANDNREVEYKEYYTIGAYDAGAVLNHSGSGTTVTFFNTSVYDSGIENYDQIEGGAVYIENADLNILGSSFENCFADALYEAYGGAVYVENGNVTVDATEKSETSEPYRQSPEESDPDDPDVNPDDPTDPDCDPSVCYEYEYRFSRFESNYASADYTTAYNPIAVYAYVTDHYPRDIRSGFDPTKLYDPNDPDKDPTQWYVRDAQAKGGALCVVCSPDEGYDPGEEPVYDVALTGVTFLENSVKAVSNNYEIEVFDNDGKDISTFNAIAGGGALFVGDRINLSATAADNENKRVDTLPQITSFIGNTVSAEARSTEFIATDWGKNPLARAAGGAVGMAGCSDYVVKFEGVVLAKNSVTALSEWGTAEAYGGGMQVCNNGIADLMSYIYTASDGTEIEFETAFDGNTLSADGRFGAYAYGGGMSNYAFSARTGSSCGCEPIDPENPDVPGDEAGAIHVVNTSFNHNEVSVHSLTGYAEAFGGGLYSRGELVFYVNETTEPTYEQGWIKSGRDKYEQQFNVLFNGNSLLADGNATKNCSPETIAAAAAGGGLYIADWQNAPENPNYTIYELENIQADNNTVRVISTNADICQSGDLIAKGGGIALDDPYVALVLFTGSSASGNTVSAISTQGKETHANYDYQESRVEGAGLYVRAAEQIVVEESRAARNTGIATAFMFGEALGGGIYAASAQADVDVGLDIHRGRFIDNTLEATANAFGGGIYYQGEVGMNLYDSSFIGENTVKAVNAFGGGLYAETEGTVTIGCDGEETLIFEYAIISAQQSRVYMNSVDGLDKTAAYTANGGGLYVTGGETLDITDATGIYGNSAGTNGGGIYAARLTGELNIAVGSWLRDNYAAERGGAIFSVDNGTLTLDNIVFTNNRAGLDGGAIYSNLSKIIVNLCTFTENSAGNFGGAIYTLNSAGLTVDESLFNKNTAVMRGGAIYNNTLKLTVSVTQFIANSTTAPNGYGGAICNLGYEQAEIFDSNFRQNTAFGAGGAIYNYMATTNNDAGLWIERTDFTENKAGYSVTGETSEYGDGGAIYNIGGDLTMIGGADEGNQLNYNKAARSGGAIYNSRGNVRITDYYIENNSAGVDGGAIYTLGTPENSLLIIAEHINDAQLINNRAERDGGAVHTQVGPVEIDGYEITENYAGNNGGAVWYRAKTGQGDLTITGEGDAISSNTAEENGGALWLYDVNLTIDDCDFIKNKALEGSGGAIWTFWSQNTGQTLEFTGDFMLNTAGENGGAIYAESKGDQTITLTGNVSDNRADENGGAIYAESKGDQTIKLTGDVSNNTAEENGGGVYASAKTVYFTMTGDLLKNEAGCSGGGVYVYGTGNVTGKFNNSNIKENRAGKDGGAIWFANKTGENVKLTVDSAETSEISNNKAGENGGAIYHVGGKLLVRKYHLMENSAETGSGGAIYHDGGEFFLNYTDVASAKAFNAETKYNVENNTAGNDGGAIYHTGGKFGTVGLNVQDNEALRSGGAFYFGDTDYADGSAGYTYIWLSNISNNTASVAGGGIYQETGSEFALYNVLVSDNTLTRVTSFGAGVYNGADKGNYYSTTIAGNEATGSASRGGGVYIDGGTNTFTNSIVALNEAAEDAQVNKDVGVIKSSYSVSSAELNWEEIGEESLNYDDPENPFEMFIDPNNGNYHLLSYSDVAGVGNPSAVIVTDDDLDGKPRLIDGTISMGAYENYDDTPAPKTQRVYGNATPERVCTGTEVVLDIWHDASTDKTTGLMTGVTSLTLRVHYNSNILTFNADSVNTKAVTGKEGDLIIVGGQWFHDYADTDNYDHDSRTDRYIMVSWNNENGWGAGELATVNELMKLSFTAKELSVNTTTQVNFTSKFLTQGYEFLSKSILVNVVAPNFDVDDNGVVDLNDVSMIIRYFNAEQNGTLDDLDLDDLIDQNGAQRRTTTEVADYIHTNESIFNIDGNRGTPGFTESVDGELLRRYFSGYRMCPLVDSIYFLNANRNTWQSIEPYIEHYTYGEDADTTRPETPYHVVTGDVSTAAVTGQSVTVSVSHKLYDVVFASTATEKFIQGVINTDYSVVDAEGKETVFKLFDINGDGKTDWVDAELFARYLDGKKGIDLVDGLGRTIETWTRYQSTDIVKYLKDNKAKFDADGNGEINEVDSTLFARYIDGKRGTALTEGLDKSTWGRIIDDFTSTATEEFIQGVIDTDYLDVEGKTTGFKLFDINGDGATDLVDAELFARYLDGKKGIDLVDGLGRTNAWTRFKSVDIITYLDANKAEFNADGNGEINDVDSTLFARYIDGKRGTDLTGGFDKSAWGRPTEDIEDILSASTLSLRIHYNSKLFTFNQKTSKFVWSDDQVLPPTANPRFVDLADTLNEDDDENTDRYVLVTWNDPDGKFGTADFEEMFNAVFTVKDKAVDTGNAHFNLTAADLTANYRFGGWDEKHNTVVKEDTVKIGVEFVDTAEVNFDIDKNLNAFYLVNVENDINLMYRYVFVKSSPPETELTDEEWEQVVYGLTKYEKEEAISIVKESLDVDNNKGIQYMLDIDGNGVFSTQDVKILERYLDGFTGDKLIEDLETPAVRSLDEIVQHIKIYLPPNWDANALALYSFTDGLEITPRTLSEEIDPKIQGILLYVNAAESAMTLDSLALSSVTAPVTVSSGLDDKDERFADTLAEIDQNDESFWDSFDPAFAFEESEAAQESVSPLDEAILDFNWEE